METARISWSRIPNSEDDELDDVSLFGSSNGNNIFGSIDFVGGGLALGKGGPLGSTKYHQSLRWLQVFKSDYDLRDLVRGHQDRMFSRNGDVECPLLNGLLVQDRMLG
ncbi:hypothetical protein Peur_005373 [Populus x canadensis]